MYRMLGNSVVPACVCLAWNTFVGLVRDAPPNPRVPAPDKLRFGHVSVHRRGAAAYLVVRQPVHMYLRRPLQLPQGVTKRLWATPIYSFVHLNKSLLVNGNKRGLNNLINQVAYERTTIAKYKPVGMDLDTFIRSYVVNPRFLEWLMGYPTAWTDVSHHDKRLHHKLVHKRLMSAFDDAHHPISNQDIKHVPVPDGLAH